ncbi:MAG: hypothetical protein LC772_06755 [Chloroflexi bacterium]|nr:hypothetical protein [Chloroflexota bacterium]
MTTICPLCGQPRERWPSYVARRPQGCCSKSCAAQLRWMRKRQAFASQSAPGGQTPARIGRQNRTSINTTVRLSGSQIRFLRALGQGCVARGVRSACRLAAGAIESAQNREIRA